jgi:hypothetical protein
MNRAKHFFKKNQNQNAQYRYVSEVYMGRIKCEVIALDTNAFEGTADALRAPEVRRVIDDGARDFMLVAGDTICDVTLHGLVDLHHRRDASLTVLLARSRVGGGGGKSGGGGGGGSRSNRAEDDVNNFVVTDRASGRLVASVSAMDVSDAGSMLLPRSALQRCPNTQLRMDLADLHVYIFAAWAIEVLDARPEFCSVAEDLMPFLVHHQFDCERNPLTPADAQSALPPSAPTCAQIDADLATRLSSTTKRNRRADPVRCFAHILYDDDEADAGGCRGVGGMRGWGRCAEGMSGKRVAGLGF